MEYVVVVTDEAQRGIDEAVDWYAERSNDIAVRWLEALERAIETLESDPQRLPSAREAEHLGSDSRQINFGVGRKSTHRMVFVIRDDQVVIHAVRHLAQLDLDEVQ